jgi:hypothetical protein
VRFQAVWAFYDSSTSSRKHQQTVNVGSAWADMFSAAGGITVARAQFMTLGMYPVVKIALTATLGGIEMNNQTQTVEFVQREHFVERALELQEKYKAQWAGWDEFLEAYRKHANSIDSNNFELDEWAFLCEEFQADLLCRELHADDNDPPWQSGETESQRPEISSGLFFGATRCLTRRSISPV